MAVTPNFVISTGAKRSGEICGFPYFKQIQGAPYLARFLRQIWETTNLRSGTGSFAVPDHVASQPTVLTPQRIIPRLLLVPLWCGSNSLYLAANGL